MRLRDSTGKLVDYVDTKRTRMMRRQVAALNEAFESASIRLSSTDTPWVGDTVVVDSGFVHPAQIAGYRVFNNKWFLGGRFYGPFWQNLSKNRRRDLMIDEACVTELDFAQLHPRLLYAEFGAPLVDDAYKIVFGCSRVGQNSIHLAQNQRSFFAFVFKAERKLLSGLFHGLSK